jgi:hypothetical protein
MSKTIWKVFVILIVLVLGLIAWQIMFKGGGVVRVIWNAAVTPVEDVVNNVVGSNVLNLQWGADAGKVDAQVDNNNLNSQNTNAVQ